MMKLNKIWFLTSFCLFERTGVFNYIPTLIAFLTVAIFPASPSNSAVNVVIQKMSLRRSTCGGSPLSRWISDHSSWELGCKNHAQRVIMDLSAAEWDVGSGTKWAIGGTWWIMEGSQSLASDGIATLRAHEPERAGQRTECQWSTARWQYKQRPAKWGAPEKLKMRWRATAFSGLVHDVHEREDRHVAGMLSTIYRKSYSGLASEDLCGRTLGWTLHPIEKTFPIIIT
jgi:hypothetical protein